jgi:hypothetical protein
MTDMRITCNSADVAIVTPTGDRPLAFSLCERWMETQDYPGTVQWVVVDDGKQPTECTLGQQHIIRERGNAKGHTLTRNMRVALEELYTHALLIVEDDDWYAPNYVSTMLERLKEHDMVGEKRTIHYHIRKAQFFVVKKHYASLASTCFTGRKAFDRLYEQCNKRNTPDLDSYLWKKSDIAKKLYDPTCRPLIVQIKGMPGRRGHTKSHVKDHRYRADNNHARLREWLADDMCVYEEFVLNA